MPIRIGPGRRLAAVATAPVGMAITAWSYIWRITPVHRVELEGSVAEDRPPPLPPGVSHEEVQFVEDGLGPLFHRTYTGMIAGADLRAGALIEKLAEDPKRVVPLNLARFTKTSGD